jgi:hypothetical protein
MEGAAGWLRRSSPGQAASRRRGVADKTGPVTYTRLDWSALSWTAVLWTVVILWPF